MQGSQANNQSRPAVVVLILLAVGVVGLSYVPWTSNWAAVFLIAGLVMMLMALILTLRPRSDD